MNLLKILILSSFFSLLLIKKFLACEESIDNKELEFLRYDTINSSVNSKKKYFNKKKKVTFSDPLTFVRVFEKELTIYDQDDVREIVTMPEDERNIEQQNIFNCAKAYNVRPNDKYIIRLLDDPSPYAQIEWKK